MSMCIIEFIMGVALLFRVHAHSQCIVYSVQTTVTYTAILGLILQLIISEVKNR